eukprot:jgi/Psemu1/2718/gm1.2718_g
MAPTINMAPTAAPSSGSGGRKAGIGNYTKPELENLNKYIRLYRKKMPTGDLIKLWDVKQAKEIKYLIGDRASILNGEERFDLETGEFVPADDDQEPSDPPPIPLCQPTQLTQATTQSTQGTPPALLLGQPTQPTQIDEVTELTSTSTISGGVTTSSNKKRAYNCKVEKDTHLMGVIAAALKEGREDRKLHQQALELQQRQQEEDRKRQEEDQKLHQRALQLQQRQQDKADEERKVMLPALIAQLGTCGGPSTAEGKSVKRKLKDLRLSLADDCPLPPSADDGSSSSNESAFE